MTQQESPVVRYLRDPSLLLEDALERVRDALGVALELAPMVIPALLALLLARLLLGRLHERRLAEAARLIAIGVPPEVEPEGALLLWSALHDLLRPRLARLLKGQPQLAWEIGAGRGGSQFRIWVPSSVPPGLVERALAAAWPGLTTSALPAVDVTAGGGETRSGEDVDDALLAGAGEVLAAAELVLSGSEWFPLGGRDGPDPLRLVLGQLSGLAVGERALVQVVARPATVREQRRLLATARRIRAGTSPFRIGRLLDLVLPGPQARPALDPTVNPDVRAVLEKASHPLYRCLVRVAVTSADVASARGRIHALAGAFAGYEGRVGLRRRRVRAARRKLRLRTLSRRGYLLSLPELAALAHLPGERALPGLARAGARSVAPPPGLPSDGKPLGLSASGEPVALAVADARYHLHLLGPTGVGKSTLLARLALADLEAGRGAVVIDPKGDLVEEILERIPAGLEDRVDLLDPLDPAPPGLNVLEGSDHDLVVDQLVGIFRRVYERFWGPRTDDILRAALLTLLAAGGRATLADVPRLLSDEQWREQLLLEFEDPVGLEPFWEWYDGLGEAVRAQATGPVLNKLRAFLLRRPVRAIVGQERSTIDVTRALDEGGLLLVRVPKGTLGEDTSRLLGSFVVARVWQAALARASRPEPARPDCALYVDEVHNYLNLPTPLDEMIAEARGYHLSLCLAHQHLAQLPKEMREAIAANARSKLYFQLSPHDAQALAREVEPELAAHDLAHLPRHTAAVRLCKSGETGPAFTLTTQPLPAGDPERAETVRADARQRKGRAREQVEAQLAERQTRPWQGAPL
jgi:TraM recognition site of TraD and TraG/Type IV secretion-system coupling protein DNA-binding domain